jgi:hypothetical protein
MSLEKIAPKTSLAEPLFYYLEAHPELRPLEFEVLYGEWSVAKKAYDDYGYYDRKLQNAYVKANTDLAEYCSALADHIQSFGAPVTQVHEDAPMSTEWMPSVSLSGFLKGALLAFSVVNSPVAAAQIIRSENSSHDGIANTTFNNSLTTHEIPFDRSEFNETTQEFRAAFMQLNTLLTALRGKWFEMTGPQYAAHLEELQLFIKMNVGEFADAVTEAKKFPTIEVFTEMLLLRKKLLDLVTPFEKAVQSKTFWRSENIIEYLTQKPEIDEYSSKLERLYKEMGVAEIGIGLNNLQSLPDTKALSAAGFQYPVTQTGKRYDGISNDISFRRECAAQGCYISSLVLSGVDENLREAFFEQALNQATAEERKNVEEQIRKLTPPKLSKPKALTEALQNVLAFYKHKNTSAGFMKTPQRVRDAAWNVPLELMVKIIELDLVLSVQKAESLKSFLAKNPDVLTFLYENAAKGVAVASDKLSKVAFIQKEYSRAVGFAAQAVIQLPSQIDLQIILVERCLDRIEMLTPEESAEFDHLYPFIYSALNSKKGTPENLFKRASVVLANFEKLQEQQKTARSDLNWLLALQGGKQGPDATAKTVGINLNLDLAALTESENDNALVAELPLDTPANYERMTTYSLKGNRLALKRLSQTAIKERNYGLAAIYAVQLVLIEPDEVEYKKLVEKGVASILEKEYPKASAMVEEWEKFDPKYYNSMLEWFELMQRYADINNSGVKWAVLPSRGTFAEMGLQLPPKPATPETLKEFDGAVKEFEKKTLAEKVEFHRKWSARGVITSVLGMIDGYMKGSGLEQNWVYAKLLATTALKYQAPEASHKAKLEYRLEIMEQGRVISFLKSSSPVTRWIDGFFGGNLENSWINFSINLHAVLIPLVMVLYVYFSGFFKRLLPREQRPVLLLPQNVENEEENAKKTQYKKNIATLNKFIAAFDQLKEKYAPAPAAAKKFAESFTHLLKSLESSNFSIETYSENSATFLDGCMRGLLQLKREMNAELKDFETEQKNQQDKAEAKAKDTKKAGDAAKAREKLYESNITKLAELRGTLKEDLRKYKRFKGYVEQKRQVAQEELNGLKLADAKHTVITAKKAEIDEYDKLLAYYEQFIAKHKAVHVAKYTVEDYSHENAQEFEESLRAIVEAQFALESAIREAKEASKKEAAQQEAKQRDHYETNMRTLRALRAKAFELFQPLIAETASCCQEIVGKLGDTEETVEFRLACQELSGHCSDYLENVFKGDGLTLQDLSTHVEDLVRAERVLNPDHPLRCAVGEQYMAMQSVIELGDAKQSTKKQSTQKQQSSSAAALGKSMAKGVLASEYLEKKKDNIIEITLKLRMRALRFSLADGEDFADHRLLKHRALHYRLVRCVLLLDEVFKQQKNPVFDDLYVGLPDYFTSERMGKFTDKFCNLLMHNYFRMSDDESAFKESRDPDGLYECVRTCFTETVLSANTPDFVFKTRLCSLLFQTGTLTPAELMDELTKKFNELLMNYKRFKEKYDDATKLPIFKDACKMLLMMIGELRAKLHLSHPELQNTVEDKKHPLHPLMFDLDKCRRWRNGDKHVVDLDAEVTAVQSANPFVVEYILDKDVDYFMARSADYIEQLAELRKLVVPAEALSPVARLK